MRNSCATVARAQLHTQGFTMFIAEGRTLGVIAALGAVLSMVVVFDRLSDAADPTEPGSPAAITTASTTSVTPMRLATPRLPAAPLRSPAWFKPLGSGHSRHDAFGGVSAWD
jgi:hypothetical protein